MRAAELQRVQPLLRIHQEPYECADLCSAGQASAQGRQFALLGAPEGRFSWTGKWERGKALCRFQAEDNSDSAGKHPATPGERLLATNTRLDSNGGAVGRCRIAAVCLKIQIPPHALS